MRQIRFVIAGLALAAGSLLVAGCGPGYTSLHSSSPTTSGTYTVTVAASQRPAAAESRVGSADGFVSYPGSADYTVTVASADGFAGTVNLAEAGLPEGFATAFDASSVVLSRTAASVSRTLTVTPTSPTVADYTWRSFVVRGTNSGKSVDSNTARIRVTNSF